MKMQWIKRTTLTLTGVVLGIGSTAHVLADDTEIFVGGNVATGSPNILLILDTSGSMGTLVTTQTIYDPATVYPPVCPSGRTYWRQNAGNAPSDCLTDNRWFETQVNECDRMTQDFATAGFSILDFMAQYDPVDKRWEQMRQSTKNNTWVECDADYGIHGKSGTPQEPWPANGTDGPWTDDVSKAITWGSGLVNRRYIAYDENYMNWQASGATAQLSRLAIMQSVLSQLINQLTGVNVGVMRFSRNGEGGMVVHEILPIAGARTTLINSINSFQAGGVTPLSETMYEAAMYYMGRPVDYGLNSTGNGGVFQPSINSSRIPPPLTLYDSPMDTLGVCQRNFTVLLTDGRPVADFSAEARIEGITNPDFSSVVAGGQCDDDGNGGNAICLDDVADYMFNADLDNDPSNGQQNVTTYTVGFDINFGLLDETANRGGGQKFLANDTATLLAALSQIITQILDSSQAFTAPTVAVNAFNRTQHLNDLFISMFKPEGVPHWEGNLKKYKLVAGEIVGLDGTTPVVDPATGFFLDTAQSIWAPGADGSDVNRGGAANQQVDPLTRNVYTYLGSYPGTPQPIWVASNNLDKSNAAITDTILNIGAPTDPNRDTLLDWARGADVNDIDGDGNINEARFHQGDPLHAQPAAIVYGGTPAVPDINDTTVYSTTNDGYLHAVDATTGQELWAFVPQELLANLRVAFENDPAIFKGYGLDGDIAFDVIDTNGDGVVDPSDNDKVYLYFGMRRGGFFNFGLDVTNRQQPAIMWAIGSADLPETGHTWGKPIPAKVDIGGTVRRVVFLSGGYDTTQDNNPGYTQDVFGNRVFMVDADTGALLWHAGDQNADLDLPEMVNSIPADLNVLDLNRDGLADRIYAADTGGSVWRFDIFNGQSGSNLVTGGKIATLGAADLGSPTLADNRRFYNAADVSLNADTNGVFLNIAIGSGYRAHPLDQQAADRFYSLRDYNVFNQLTQNQYNSLTPITDGALVDITGNANPVIPTGAAGWKITFPGEKVLASSQTFNNVTLFTTFTPGAAAGNSCQPSLGTNKLFILSTAGGTPVYNLDGVGSPTALTASDQSTTLAQTGITPEISILFPSPDIVGDNDGDGYPDNWVDTDGDGIPDGPPRPGPVCLVALESCPVNLNNPLVRTYWSQQGASN